MHEIVRVRKGHMIPHPMSGVSGVVVALATITVLHSSNLNLLHIKQYGFGDPNL